MEEGKWVKREGRKKEGPSSHAGVTGALGKEGSQSVQMGWYVVSVLGTLWKRLWFWPSFWFLQGSLGTLIDSWNTTLTKVFHGRYVLPESPAYSFRLHLPGVDLEGPDRTRCCWTKNAVFTQPCQTSPVARYLQYVKLELHRTDQRPRFWSESLLCFDKSCPICIILLTWTHVHEPPPTHAVHLGSWILFYLFIYLFWTVENRLFKEKDIAGN